jgi:hypothetical protein
MKSKTMTAVIKTIATEIQISRPTFYVYHADGVRLHLLTAATTRPIVYPPCDISAWRAMLELSSTGDYS